MSNTLNIIKINESDVQISGDIEGSFSSCYKQSDNSFICYDSKGVMSSGDACLAIIFGGLVFGLIVGAILNWLSQE